MGETSKQSLTVLVIDDEASIRELFAVILRRAGYRVVEATAARQAIEVVVRERPDLILVDINMPGEQSGLYLVRMLRMAAPAPLRDVPIVVITGLDPTEWKEKALEAGCDEFLTKPVDPDKLIEVVKDYTA